MKHPLIRQGEAAHARLGNLFESVGETLRTRRFAAAILFTDGLIVGLIIGRLT
jgi:hypothetical protein